MMYGVCGVYLGVCDVLILIEVVDVGYWWLKRRV